ncbi:DUF6886 family protein [Clostridium sp.]|uniref:DUF6886 family protein n=1 Tax=Clostridium sp. TaxID=1506 RepID=UPI0032167ADF
MRLFHVSEEKDIEIFHPRQPSRTDLNRNVGLVWAINEACLTNFLTPRDCPRVTYHVGKNTQLCDIQKYISSKDCSHVIAIENKWFNVMKNTTLYLYEFDVSDFYLQDEVAGYYVSEKTQLPINKIEISDLFSEIFLRNVEVRMLGNLWDLCDEIKMTTFHWSMCRMGNALSRL